MGTLLVILTDGKTPAQGPNLEGCPSCNNPELGCCPDGVTPKSSIEDKCECHSQKHGECQLNISFFHRHYDTETC